MKKFSAFLDRKSRSSKAHLKLIGELLSKAGFRAISHLDHHDEPFVFISKPIEADPIIENLEFGGIRLYTRGSDIISFRPQNKENVEPFGTAYLLDVKGMYKDLMHKSQDIKAGTELVKYIVEEVLNFFIYCAKAQKDDEKDVDDDKLGKVINAKSAVNDFGNMAGGDIEK